jgi:hypothetical protein
LIYGQDDEFLASAAPFLAEGVDRSDAVLAITTDANVNLLRERLGPIGEQVEFVDSETWYTAPASALEAYRKFCSAKLEGGAPWIRIVGEPVWAERPESEVRLWTRYESLLNVVFASWPIEFLCAYDERTVEPEIVTRSCVTHPHTIANGRIRKSSGYESPSGFVLADA